MTGSTTELVGVALLIVTVALVGCRGAPDETPDTILPEGAAGWSAAGPVDRWDTETIYDYIDGHAEVYLAYGMQRCLSRRYAGPEGEPDILVDVFELPSPEDAFGVFTHDRSGDPVDVGRDARYRWGWLSFWQGPCFVSVTAESDTERARAAVLELGETIAASLPSAGDRPAIVNALPMEDLDPDSVRYLHHPTVLNAHLWTGPDNPFDLDASTPAALGRYRIGDDGTHVLLVDYPDPERARAAVDSAMPDVAAEGDVVATDDGWVAWRMVGASRAAFVLGGSSEEATATIVDRIGAGG